MGESLRHLDSETTPAALLYRPSCRPDAVGNETSCINAMANASAHQRLRCGATSGAAAKILIFDREPSLRESGQLLISVGDLGQRLL